MLLAPVARILRSLLPILAIIVFAGFSSGVQARSSSPIPDAAIPTVVSAFSQKVGTVLYVTLTGQTSGGVWGSNPSLPTLECRRTLSQIRAV